MRKAKRTPPLMAGELIGRRPWRRVIGRVTGMESGATSVSAPARNSAYKTDNIRLAISRDEARRNAQESALRADVFNSGP